MKKVIECEVFVQSQYGKIDLVYVPKCTIGVKLLEHMNNKLGKERSSFAPSMMNEVLSLVDVKVIRVPLLPKIPHVGEILKQQANTIPDFLK